MDQGNELIGTMGQPLRDEPTAEIYLTEREILSLSMAISDSLEKASFFMDLHMNGQLTAYFKAMELKGDIEPNTAQEAEETTLDVSTQLMNDLPIIAEELVEALNILKNSTGPDVPVKKIIT